jgi:EAL domain-containing protein (putative c-di-GMP-specific phosphodiesterase class I)
MSVGDGSLELVYQPEVDLRTGEIVAMEALLRWRYGDLGVLQPHAFMPLATRTGMMGTIDIWVLAAAATQAASWRELDGTVRTLWMNVSLAQLADDRHAQRVAHVIRTFRLPRRSLGVEVSEQALTQLGNQAEAVLERLRQLGVSIVADDFNSYYQGVGALASLPLDGVKLAHRFVRGGDLDHDRRARAVIGQAHERGMYVVAEGVETQREHDRLLELGCDRAHGFLYSRPLPADEARQLLEQGMHWRPADAAPPGAAH